MRRVIGIGETILDIIFRGSQPVAAVHGGSSFNSLISIGRAGVPSIFVGYAGQDIVGYRTADFMLRNGVSTDYFEVRPGERSAVSLAFLSDRGDARYIFYKEPPHVGDRWAVPHFEVGDVILFGSYYAVCYGTRPMVADLLARADQAGAILYYDLNYRASHRDELDKLMPTILNNFMRTTIVRGSADDFEVMYGLRDAQKIYDRYVSDYCPYFICTAGAEPVTVCTPANTFRFPAPRVADVVSTVGAGDSFNAGFACALIWQGLARHDLAQLPESAWQQLISTACLFAADSCRSAENYVRPGFRVKRR